jgi:hypothetical protein
MMTMIKKRMLLLAAVGAFALMNGSANAEGKGTDCEFKPSAEKLAVGKDVWTCRTLPGRDSVGRDNRDNDRDRDTSASQGET